jgi:hypothetical protein
MIRLLSAPIRFNGIFGAAEVLAGAVVPSMDPGQGGLGIMGLGDEAAWLEYTPPRQNEEWDLL